MVLPAELFQWLFWKANVVENTKEQETCFSVWGVNDTRGYLVHLNRLVAVLSNSKWVLAFITSSRFSAYVCMYACMYVCMYVCMCACVCMCLCVCVCIYVCIYVCMYVSMYKCLFVFIYVCTYVCRYICRYVYMYACIYVGMYACANVRTYGTNTDKNTHMIEGESSSVLTSVYAYLRNVQLEMRFHSLATGKNENKCYIKLLTPVQIRYNYKFNSWGHCTLLCHSIAFHYLFRVGMS